MILNVLVEKIGTRYLISIIVYCRNAVPRTFWSLLPLLSLLIFQLFRKCLEKKNPFVSLEVKTFVYRRTFVIFVWIFLSWFIVDLDNINNFALKSAAGVLEADDTLGLETAHLQELSVIVNTTSSFEEFFIRRNALIIFMHRILRSAQLHHASLRPSIPGSSSFCTCK